MYDELVKKLRSHNGWALNETLDEAADAIEELQDALQLVCCLLRRQARPFNLRDLRKLSRKAAKGGMSMSILIKGISMPTSCCQCPVNMYLCKRGYEYLLEHPALYDERAEDCPLVPVPPHGRLIDGDVAEAICFTNEDADGKDFYDGILYAADFISQQPTIIEEER